MTTTRPPPCPPAPARVWSLYVLRCSDDTLYTGIAVDVAARVKAHDAGRGARYTRGRGPVTLLLTRPCASESCARRLEPRVKRLSRTQKESLVAGDDALWAAIAPCDGSLVAVEAPAAERDA